MHQKGQEPVRWGYSDEAALGPGKWAKHFNAGHAQSPINILVDDNYLVQRHHHRLIAGELNKQLQLSRDLKGGQRRSHLDSTGNENSSPDIARDHEQEERNSIEIDNGQYSSSDRRSPASSSSHQSSGSNSPIKPPLNSRSNQQRSIERGGIDDNENKIVSHDFNRLLQRQQSTQTTRYCGTNKKIFLGYPRYLNTLQLANTGHGWQINVPPELACHTLLTGPPFANREYRLAQFHCHWGADCAHGSEHQINGESFSAEIHFVHWNCSQFNSIEEASKHRHGLAVLGVFVQALDGEQNRNKHLDKIIAGIPKVCDQPHTNASLRDTRLDLKKLFPANRWNYATYEGSLTTPPLLECVDWLVFLQPITCSSSQIDQFRQLKSHSGALTKNCRPVQALNQRTVTIWTHINN